MNSMRLCDNRAGANSKPDDKRVLKLPTGHLCLIKRKAQV